MKKEVMNSRERVLRAIRHQEPDRIPIDISAVEEVMDALIDYYGISTSHDFESKTFMGVDGTLFERKKLNAQLALLEKLHIDFRWAWAPYIGPELKVYPDGSRDGLFGVKRGGLFFGYALDHPLQNAQTIKDIEEYPWEVYANIDHYDYQHYAQECRNFHEQGYAVYGGPWAPISFWAMDLMGMDRFLIALYDSPELVMVLIQKISDFYFRQAEIMFEVGAGYTDIFFMGDDYGMQNCPIVSPELWRKFFAPHLKRLWELAKSFGLIVQLHSCGSVRPLIPDFIQMGLDVLDPIQVRARGMIPEELKKEFGKDLAFHGSIDTQQTLPFGTPTEVRNEVLHRLKTMAQGGGFILSPSQHLLTEIPIGNIISMYETVYEYGWYPDLYQLKG
ncbi:MAG: hypothetical protein GX428_05420 [Candidatus Atribacteria bacterium]|nr:hypothetical protein [Candidatus Atribacteria bacterium]